MGPEAKFYQQIKRNFKSFSLIRLENSSLLGSPDLLVCNTSGYFFTLELKVTRGNKVRFSPHQFSFHLSHPENTFIIVKALSLNQVKLYEGKVIKELDTQGLQLEPCSLGLEACISRLVTL